MALDKDTIEQLFNQAAEEGLAQKQAEAKTTLKAIWTKVADKFNDPSFVINEYGTAPNEGISITSKLHLSKSLQVQDNGDGTFCVNSDRHETHNQTSPEITIAALGRFYGRHGNSTAKPI